MHTYRQTDIQTDERPQSLCDNNKYILAAQLLGLASKHDLEVHTKFLNTHIQTERERERYHMSFERRETGKTFGGVSDTRTSVGRLSSALYELYVVSQLVYAGAHCWTSFL